MDPVGKTFSLDKHNLVRGITSPHLSSLRSVSHKAALLLFHFLLLSLARALASFQDFQSPWNTTHAPTVFCTQTPLCILPGCGHQLLRELGDRSNVFFVFSLSGNFHIRNGAWMWRLNWLADVSPKGMDNSFGLMMNYKYVLEDVDKNNQQYLLSGTVAASPQFLQPLQ